MTQGASSRTRRFALVLGTAVITVVSGGQSATAGAGFDSATGAGIATDGTPFGFFAHGGDNDVQGRISTTVTSGGTVLGQIIARATCLDVGSNTATIGGEVVVSHAVGGGQIPGLEVGTGVVLFAEDNGPSVSGATPDQLDFIAMSEPPTMCPPFQINVNQIARGRIVVHDG